MVPETTHTTKRVRRHKKLYRSRKERVIAGVCAGLADYFGIDATWVRVIFLVLFFAAGATFWIYLLMWLIVPLEPKEF